MNVDDLATAALEIDSSEQREAFLRQACEGDDVKLAKVRALVDALQQCEDDQFLGGGLFADSKPSNAASASVGNPTASDSGPSQRFEIRCRHAEGGLGEVFIAWDNQLARSVALKQIKPQWSDNPDAAGRFRREAEITGYLEHPGIVPIYSMGNDFAGRPFYAMQLIQGETLKDVVQRHLGLNSASTTESKRSLHRWYDLEVLRDLLNRFRDVCLTIDYAHSRHVIHRDLKPSNIMLGAYGQTLVVDWGLAKRTDELGKANGSPDIFETGTMGIPEFQSHGNPGSSVAETQHGTTMGTPRFMSPEQARGDVDRIGELSDVYCLGGTLYYILTGRAPHEGEADLESTLKKIFEGRIEWPNSMNPHIPRALSAIAMKAMQKAPTKRYGSAGEIAIDIEHYLADQPVSVYKTPPTERLIRLARKNPARSAAIFVASFLLIIGAVIGLAVQDEMVRRKLESARRQSLADREIEYQTETRQNEARAMVDAAMERSEAAIASGRYADAAMLANLAIERMGELRSFDSVRRIWIEKRDRLHRLGEFESLVRRGEDLDYLARDTEAAILLQSSLGIMNVLDSDRWWDELPVDDLSPQQADAMRWRVYRVLTALNSIYLKRMVIVMGGDKDGQTPSLLRLLRSFLTSKVGTAEAEATVELTRRIETFRPSQSAKWLGSIARYRLHQGTRVEPETLAPPENAADGLELAIASLIASIDPAYRTWFKDYGVTFVPRSEQSTEQSYPVEVALETLRRSLDLAPDDYWICMTMGQAYFLTAQSAQQSEDHQAAIEAFNQAKTQYGRCIAIRPETAFAYADRATIGLELALEIRDQPNQWQGKQERIDQLLKRSLRDASQATRLVSDQDWPYWHLGATAAHVGQHRLAIDSFFYATDLGFDVADSLDGAILKLKDLRGRRRAIEYAKRRFSVFEQDRDTNLEAAELASLLASLEYSRDQIESAAQWAEKSIELNVDQWRANEILGWCSLQTGQPGEAEQHFRLALAQTPSSVVSMMGLALVLDRRSDEFNQEALSLYRKATEIAVTTRHQSNAWFGIAKQAVRDEAFDQAVKAIEQARKLDPACDVSRFADIARQQAIVWLKQSRQSSDVQQKDAYVEKIQSLRKIADQVAELPNASVNEIIHASTGQMPRSLPLLNAAFDLPIGQYWNLRNGMNTRPEQEQVSVRPVLSQTQIGDHSRAGTLLRIDPMPESDEVAGSANSAIAEPSSQWELFQSIPATAGLEYQVSIRIRNADGFNDPDQPPYQLLVRHQKSELLRQSITGIGVQWSNVSGAFRIPEQSDLIETIDVALVIPTGTSPSIEIDWIRCDRQPTSTTLAAD
ncbi:serine/threonine-protein kinase [Stieleria sp. JC731]|uniref:serine/threonine-protein kinase n=1 Tax=Pirellulaceae TaxID=2691357 RepID=UPI001E40F508|nr:serine/threonine-protein kinase [Stieleria sp. JC731]MCC9603823.1 serine/threonine-protein kinase [Stieleria sp. JC731]